MTIKNIKQLNLKEVKDFLDIKNDYTSETFWNEDSDSVFYQDGDLDTVKNECVDYAKDVLSIDNHNYQTPEDCINDIFDFIHIVDKNYDQYVALYRYI